MPMNKYGEIVRNSSPPPPISSNEKSNNRGNGSIIAIVVGIAVLFVVIALIISSSHAPNSANNETQISSSGDQFDNNEPNDLVEDVENVKSADTSSSTEMSDEDAQEDAGEFLVEEYSANSEYPFYGIWCDASRNLNIANNYVVDWESKGWDAYVFLTSEWSNLNQENWYAVSVGIYSSKEDALQYLEEIQKSQPDAYIKYSGEYQGK